MTPGKDGGVHLEINPYIPGDMEHAEMSYTTVWGTIRLGWKKVETSGEKPGRKIIFHAELPGAAVADFVYGEKKAVWKGGIYEVEI